MIARLLAQGLAASLGQAVIVDNRGAAGGMVAAELLSRAAPDGHTLLFYSSGLWTSPLIEGKTSHDVTRDFAPITSAASTPNVLVVHSALPVNSVKDLIALAKGKPGMLNYGSGSLGSSNHVAAELFNYMAGVKIERVPYISLISHVSVASQGATSENHHALCLCAVALILRRCRPAAREALNKSRIRHRRTGGRRYDELSQSFPG